VVYEPPRSSRAVTKASELQNESETHRVAKGLKNPGKLPETFHGNFSFGNFGSIPHWVIYT